MQGEANILVTKSEYSTKSFVVAQKGLHGFIFKPFIIAHKDLQSFISSLLICTAPIRGRCFSPLPLRLFRPCTADSCSWSGIRSRYAVGCIPCVKLGTQIAGESSVVTSTVIKSTGRNRACKYYAGKAVAEAERPFADSLYACGYGYADKAGATHERPFADRRYVCGDGYAGKAGAIGERIVADRRYAFGYGYAGKAGAATERSLADRRYAFGNGYVGKAGALVERIGADRRYAGGNGYACKAGALVERIGADRRYAFGNGYVGKAGALVERIVADRRYAFGNGYAGKAGAILEHTVANRCYALWYGYTGKAGATAERIGADSGKLAAFSKGYAGKAGATAERLGADRRYACGNGYAGKEGATVERIGVDTRQGTAGKIKVDKLAAKGCLRLTAGHPRQGGNIQLDVVRGVGGVGFLAVQERGNAPGSGKYMACLSYVRWVTRANLSVCADRGGVYLPFPDVPERGGWVVFMVRR